MGRRTCSVPSDLQTRGLEPLGFIDRGSVLIVNVATRNSPNDPLGVAPPPPRGVSFPRPPPPKKRLAPLGPSLFKVVSKTLFHAAPACSTPTSSYPLSRISLSLMEPGSTQCTRSGAYRTEISLHHANACALSVQRWQVCFPQRWSLPPSKIREDRNNAQTGRTPECLPQRSAWRSSAMLNTSPRCTDGRLDRDGVESCSIPLRAPIASAPERRKSVPISCRLFASECEGLPSA
ncbi:hypothetical protein LZ30DRAFT_131760 [Colletotrichum cereale]|nr:hypothetical protein LZ30DRAFT_131760 [Colletotrichum cereale]